MTTYQVTSESTKSPSTACRLSYRSGEQALPRQPAVAVPVQRVLGPHRAVRVRRQPCDGRRLRQHFTQPRYHRLQCGQLGARLSVVGCEMNDFDIPENRMCVVVVRARVERCQG